LPVLLFVRFTTATATIAILLFLLLLFQGVFEHRATNGASDATQDAVADLMAAECSCCTTS